MSSSPSNEIATRASWKTLPLPEDRADLEFTASYTMDELERIKRGLIPQEMEDKWFIFFEDSWLYFYRSWTGDCIYGVRLLSSENGINTAESWVKRGLDRSTKKATDYERALLKFLIDALLLGQHVSFPVPGDVPADAPAGAYQHHVIGRAYPEIAFVEVPRIQPWWVRLIRWLKTP